MLRLWIGIGLALTFSGAAGAQSGSMVDSRADPRGAILGINLAWRSGGQNFGLLPKIIMRPEGMIVSTSRVSVHAQDYENGCASRLRNRHVPGTPLSTEEMEAVLNCRQGTIYADVDPRSSRQAAILPWGVGPRRCSDTKLTNGQYRLCAAVLQQSHDSFQMEYEEASQNSGTLLVTRARFEVVLERSPPPAPLAGEITGCSVRILAAYAFNPQNPGKMISVDTMQVSRCSRDYV